MSNEPKAVVERFFEEVINQRKLEILDEKFVGLYRASFHLPKKVGKDRLTISGMFRCL